MAPESSTADWWPPERLREVILWVLFGVGFLAVVVLTMAALGLVGILPLTGRLTLFGEALKHVTGKVAALPSRTFLLLAFLPAGLIAQHAVFLHYHRRHQIPSTGARSFGADVPGMRATEQSRAVFFGAMALALRYLFPAAMTMVVVLTALEALATGHTARTFGLEAQDWVGTIYAAQLGFAGAYFSVVSTLGHRAMRRDLTTGSALATPVFLILGPLLAGAITLLWTGTPGDTSYGRSIVFFAAGLIPLQIADGLATTARRAMGLEQPSSAASLLPLSKIRGISPEIEARLREEGISDGYALAMADPYQLLRTTPFDRRQVVSWIDEALLAMTLPLHWQKLQEIAVAGVIDLVNVPAADIDAVAQSIGWPSPPLLKSLVARLRQDAQVQIIWFLYQFDSEAEPTPNGINQQP